MYIWLGSQVDSTFIQSLFGIQTTTHIQTEKVIFLNRIFFFLIEYYLSVVLLNLIIQYQKMFDHY